MLKVRTCGVWCMLLLLAQRTSAARLRPLLRQAPGPQPPIPPPPPRAVELQLTVTVEGETRRSFLRETKARQFKEALIVALGAALDGKPQAPVQPAAHFSLSRRLEESRSMAQS